MYISVACAHGPSVNPSQNRETQHVNIVLQCMYRYKYERKSCFNWRVTLEVLPRSQLIFPSKTWFFGFYFKFQWQKSLQIQYLPHSESKSYQINFIKYIAHQDLSNNTKGTCQFLWNFQLRFNLIFSEEIIQYSRTFAPQVQRSWNQAHAPLLIKSFPKTPRTQSEASQFSGSHNYKTKQTTFLHIIYIYNMYIIHTRKLNLRQTLWYKIVTLLEHLEEHFGNLMGTCWEHTVKANKIWKLTHGSSSSQGREWQHVLLRSGTWSGF